MKYVFPTPEAFDAASAEYIYKEIAAKPSAVIGLSTGRTTGAMHRELARLLKEQPLDLSRVTFFGQDEVAGVPREYTGACYTMLKTELIGTLPLREDQFLMLPTRADDFPAACQAFVEELEHRGGIDLIVLGLGENGHLGFNQPGTPFDAPCRVASMTVELDSRIRRELSLGPEAPLAGVTLGLRDVMNARKLLLAAKSLHKAAIVKEILQGPVTEEIPASILQRHPACDYYLDADAASLL